MLGSFKIDRIHPTRLNWETIFSQGRFDRTSIRVTLGKLKKVKIEDDQEHWGFGSTH